jgi:ribosomal-protein-alanine N-acetyltransferase
VESLTRLIDREDAQALAALVRKNRAFLAPWEPLRDDSYYTVTGQREQIEEALARHDQGVAVPHVLLDRPDESTSVVVGRINLNGIGRGPLQSCRTT